MDTTWRVFSGEEGRRNRGEKVQGRRSITGRHKIDGEGLKMIWETENSKNVRYFSDYKMHFTHPCKFGGGMRVCLRVRM